MFKKIIKFFAATIAIAYATTLNCGTYVCPPGYRNITNINPASIWCPNDNCTVGTCCWPPTCVSTYTMWNGGNPCLLKTTASSIQCGGNVPTGCNSTLCCSKTSAPTAAPTFAPTSVPTSAPTAAPTSVPTSAPTSTPTAAPTARLCTCSCNDGVTFVSSDVYPSSPKQLWKDHPVLKVDL